MRYAIHYRPVYCVLAVREALVNAICHRDYSDRSGYISIAIFDDRVEIWNNGTLPNSLQLKDLKRKHDSILRNQLIANVFYLRGYIEAWGTGTTKMLQLCKENHIPLPNFSERTGGLVVTFKFASPIGLTAQPTIASQVKLNARQQEILNILGKMQPMSASEMFNALKEPPSLRTVKSDISKLKNLGLLAPEGKGRSTTWKLKP